MGTNILPELHELWLLVAAAAAAVLVADVSLAACRLELFVDEEECCYCFRGWESPRYHFRRRNESAENPIGESHLRCSDTAERMIRLCLLNLDVRLPCFDRRLESEFRFRI